MGTRFVSQHAEIGRLKFFEHGSENVFSKDWRVLPLVLSGAFLFSQIAYAYHYRSKLGISNDYSIISYASEVEDDRGRARGWVSALRESVCLRGGYVIFGFMVARLAGSLLLLYLSVITKPDGTCKDTSGFVRWVSCPQNSLTVAFAYAALLALLSFWPQHRLLSPVRFQVAVLLSALAVYAYRDVWPLATYTMQPADKAEGVDLWIKIACLVISGVIIPLSVPHSYIPVDPKNAALLPNPEQTASWISTVTFSFLDPLIIFANKVPHLKHDQLPPLADYDHALHLRNSASMYVDPFSGPKRRHLVFGLISYFRWEYLAMAFIILFISASNFAAPIGINKTLNYLEARHQGVEPSIKPWVWILCMFLGPVMKSIFDNWAFFIQTRVRVQTRALLTQLFFEHSLRIRMKAETSHEGTPTIPTSEADTKRTTSLATDSSTSVNEQENNVAEDDDIHSGGASTAVDSIATSSDTTRQSATQNAKGKTKASDEEVVPPPKKRPGSDAGNLVGKINNLVTSDISNMLEGCDILTFAFSVPIQMILSVIFLYQILGWSSLVGLSTTIVLSPVVGSIGKAFQNVQVTKMKLTDARTQSITEALGVLRMIKLFGWERKMAKRIEDRREEELAWLWKTKILQVFNSFVNGLIPTLTTWITYVSYTIIMGEGLTASKIFSSMTVFFIFRGQLERLSQQMPYMIQAKVSFDRATSFLQDTELLDNFLKPQQHTHGVPVLSDGGQDMATTIGFRNSTFSWAIENNDSITPSSRKYRLCIDGDLFFQRNCINLITGPTGSGKTAILVALLGEMHFTPEHADSWYNLPRQGGVAYAAQESWVLNTTIRENIVFGSPFDEERYKKVLYQCALEQDLELFEAGDMTEVGERGLTLSGGQKARITLARAIYSFAKIILLDDVLAALDVHTSTWVVDKCFRGNLVKERTILLVTHNIALVAPIAKFTVTLGLDGSFKTQEFAIADDDDTNLPLGENIKDQAKVILQHKDDETFPTNVSNGKLGVAEEIIEGRITLKSIKLLILGLGGKYPVLHVTLWVTGLLLAQFLWIFQSWFLGVWGSQYETHTPSEVNISYYLLVFSALLVSRIIVHNMKELFFNYRTINASRIIHAELINSVFGSTLRWLDETPTARIISRCTQDIGVIDDPIPRSIRLVADMAIGMLSTLGSIILFSPVFVFPGIVVTILGIYVGNLYLKAQLSINREMSNARSPMLAHFSAAIHGIVSIRAYGAQRIFAEESFKRIDHYSRTARTSLAVNRWINLRIDTLGAAFTSALAFYLVYGGTSISAGITGFSLNMAASFCIYIFWLIRTINGLEVECNSLERIQSYIDIEHEPKPTASGEPPAAWPTSGDLRVDGLSARYSRSGPKVLHDLSFHINSGERVGVVGRTGSGKSSLTLALLRCILTQGTIIYDGIATDKLNLDALRSNITIIPQTPELLSGTLRQNLDPFDQNDDATLNDALRAAGLFSLQEEGGQMRFTLESKIAGSGNNLSVGQRQIIALARAMVRGSKLLILDEATSAIDYSTDTAIQNTLRSKLPADVTVITVAHRLQTIMDADKIMVLEHGRIVEFDTPKALLQIKNGKLRGLVEGSADKQLLHRLAEEA